MDVKNYKGRQETLPITNPFNNTFNADVISVNTFVNRNINSQYQSDKINTALHYPGHQMITPLND